MTLDEIKAELQKNQGFSYAKAAKLTGLNKGEIWYAVNRGTYPRAPWKRKALGLDPILEIPAHGTHACTKCGAPYVKTGSNHKHCWKCQRRKK